MSDIDDLESIGNMLVADHAPSQHGKGAGSRRHFAECHERGRRRFTFRMKFSGGPNRKKPPITLATVGKS